LLLPAPYALNFAAQALKSTARSAAGYPAAGNIAVFVTFQGAGSCASAAKQV
jgi:hypothetical protein